MKRCNFFENDDFGYHSGVFAISGGTSEHTEKSRCLDDIGVTRANQRKLVLSCLRKTTSNNVASASMSLGHWFVVGAEL